MTGVRRNRQARRISQGAGHNSGMRPRRHKWIQRVLFLADRRELVRQAMDAFREHLPDAPRCWIEAGDVDRDARIHAATYPGMMGLYQHLSPGFYDLIIADESHRSIYNRYRAILDHFDALHLGLTATPTDFIDHNTFQLFDCTDDTPSFYYGYEEAVRDRYLVPYRPVHVASTHFQIEGLKPGELPPDAADAVRRQGVDPDDFSFEGTDLERRVTNTGTNDAIVREFQGDPSPRTKRNQAPRRKYDDRLIRVRYRYDPKTTRRFSTVESIESEAAWIEEPPAGPTDRPKETRRLGVRIEFAKTELREKVKQRGAIWRPRQKLWEMTYEDVVALGLEHRAGILEDDADL